MVFIVAPSTGLIFQHSNFQDPGFITSKDVQLLRIENKRPLHLGHME